MKNTLLLVLLIVFALSFFGTTSYGQVNRLPVQSISDAVLLTSLDTNFTVVDKWGQTLRYYQYKDSIKTGRYEISRNGEKRFNLFLFNPKTYDWIKSMNPSFNPVDSVTGLNKSILYNLGKHDLPTPILDKKLLKGLPKGIDTTLIFYNQYHAPLKFQEYFARMFYYYEFLALEKNGKSIWRFSDRANQDRPTMYKTKADTLNRLQDIYRNLLQADKVLVLKIKHQVILQRGNKTFMTIHCELGKNPVGDKREEGDGRTPEGFYTIVSTAEKGKYGKSLQISYPDEAHIVAAKQKGKTAGKDIMIHGTGDTRIGRKDWTNGCIALANNHIDSLFKYVHAGTTIEIRK